MKRAGVALWGMAVLLPTSASARDYCSTRPSLGQSACTIDAGRVAIETALSDWERDGDADTVLFGDTLVRLGLTDRIELQADWAPVGVVRDRATGGRTARTGDLEIGSRIALRNPDGKGLSYGLQPSVTVPTGRSPVGSGGWGASLIAPVSYDLTDRLNLQFSPEIATMPREDRGGNMAVATATLGLGIVVSDKCQVTVEGQWAHDDMATEHRAALAVAWQLSDDFFVDAGGVAGLDHDTPALRVYSGLSHRF
ncbi:transporter [Sphingomonas sp. 2R-10]|uniref:transporter n=1 Tax=Sphingomonas sp. 2R-10 TaxID=3045148 RepID=UPI000F76E6C0|nr:transporter [Sphingomonas sp. 2R-10]MDJ0277244.1 transporter [Sphingomonas sp. 2R-10]